MAASGYFPSRVGDGRHIIYLDLSGQRALHREAK
jgi:hypothetical protein